MIPDIDVRGSVARGKYEGTLEIFGEADRDLPDIPYAGFAGPVVYSLKYEIFEDDTVEVRGSVRFTLEGACSRCLAAARQTFSEEVYGFFEPGEGDGETYGYQNGVVKLGEFLRDALMFALPSRLLCGNCGSPEGESE